MVAVFALDDGRYLAFFQPEGGGKKDGIPHLAVIAVQFHFAALVLAARVIRVDLGEGFEFTLTGLYLLFIFVRSS